MFFFVIKGVTEIPDDFTGSFQDQVAEDLQQRICSKHKPQVNDHFRVVIKCLLSFRKFHFFGLL